MFNSSPLWRLIGYARPYLGAIAVALILTGALSVASYGRAYLVKPIFDDVIGPSQAIQSAGDRLPFELPDFLPGGEEPPEPADAPPPTADEAERLAALEARVAEIKSNVTPILAAAAVIILAIPLFGFGREYVVQWVLGRIDLDMKVEVCSALLALPLRFHRDQKRGDLYARIMGDVGMAQGALQIFFGNFVEATIMLLVGMAALLFISWKLSFLMLIVGPALFATISYFGRRIRKSAMSRQRQFAAVTNRLVEILEGIKVIKAFRAEAYEKEGFARSSHKFFRRGMRVVMYRVLSRSLIDGLNNLAAIVVLVIGAYLVMGGHWGLTMGDLAAFSAVSITMYRPVRMLAKGWVRLMDAAPSAERYYEVIDSPLEIEDSDDAQPISGLHRSVRFRGIGFSYGREPVLQEIDFEVPAGKVVAIVGRTGAGKTTMIDLLLRFYDPTEGSIEIDGVDLRQLSRDSVLDHMAVVSQEPFLFDGTIRDNIRYGRLDASEDDIVAAARTAHVDEFVDSLPDGYDTEVGAAGTRLSGGQRQRVTIARAILRDPAILVLDEATSSLDSKSERLVQDAIDKLLPGRTVFVIAHRLSTVRAADQIVVLEGGRISQIGSHDELIARSGLYRELVELQTGADAEPIASS